MLDPDLAWEEDAFAGASVAPETTLATLSGRARSLLTAERVALNLLQRMCGIATLTNEFVKAVANTKTKVLDTRKTIPGLRALDKYAVSCGGGVNHRFGLDDAILIKDNHIAIAGSITEALRRARAAAGHLVKIEVEIDDLEQLKEALAEGADVVDLLAFRRGRELEGVLAGRYQLDRGPRQPCRPGPESGGLQDPRPPPARALAP